MILKQLQFKNFRQFREGTIEFATDDDENVTVIHGKNGAGKTTILNAFKWLLYDEVEFKNQPQRLANEGAMAEADVDETVTVEVELTFNHEGAEYTATRTTVRRKRRRNDYKGEVVDGGVTVVIDDGDQQRRPGNPGNTLDKVIPERLSDLFFFDGEDIDKLSQSDNRDQVQEAIENIMGLTILERATRHTANVASRFENEAAEYGSDELADLIDQKQALEAEIDDLEDKRTDKQRAIEEVKREISDINQKLEQLDDSKALQQQREEYQTRIESLQSEIDEIEDAIRNQIDKNGFITVGMPLIRDTAEDINELRKQGEIPSQLSNEYLNTLIEAHECICGRPLEHGTEPYEQVTAMKGEVSTDGVDQAALRLVGKLDQLSDRKSEFFQETDRLIDERKEREEEMRRLKEKIDEISSELQDMVTTTDSGLSVSELEAQRETKVAEKEQLNQGLGEISREIEDREDRIEALEQKIGDQRDERQEALLAKRRQKAAELVHDELEDSYAGLKDKVREWSNKRVQETFEKIASKNFSAGIDDDFLLDVYRVTGDGNRVSPDLSTGERQIASLAFIGSLVKIARDRYEDETEYEYFTGGIYPLVMDSPFGALDNKHRREVSRAIPELGSQVVVLATDSQWEGPVEQQMSDRIGSQYWLDYDEGGDQRGHPRTHIRAEQTTVAGD